MFTLGEAAKETGISKSTLSRAIKAGKVSAVRNVHGIFEIEPSELFRVYPPKRAHHHATDSVTHHATADDAGRSPEVDAAALRAEIAGLKAQLDMMRDHAEDLKDQRDGWQRQAEVSQRLLSDSRPKRGGFLSLFRSNAA
jgi:hypothetical protein